MIEIFVIIHFSKKLGAIATQKGRAKGFAALGALFWFLGEILGFIIGEVLNLGMASYALAIACAALGMFIAFSVVKSLSPAPGLEDEALADSFAPSIDVQNRDPENPYSPPQKI